MSRLTTVVVIGFVLFVLGDFGRDAAMDAPGPAQTESVSSLETDAGASSKRINVSDFEAIPVAALAAKLDARVAAKEAI